jgi:hypothetical protein
MMLMVGIGGLMATAQVAPVARNFKVGAAALTIALSLNPLWQRRTAAFCGAGFPTRWGAKEPWPWRLRAAGPVPRQRG